MHLHYHYALVDQRVLYMHIAFPLTAGTLPVTKDKRGSCFCIQVDLSTVKMKAKRKENNGKGHGNKSTNRLDLIRLTRKGCSLQYYCCSNSSTASSSSASTSRMRSFSNSSTIICSSSNKRSTRRRALNGSSLTLAWISSRV